VRSHFLAALLSLATLVLVGCTSLAVQQADAQARSKRVGRALDQAMDVAYEEKDLMQREQALNELGKIAFRLQSVDQIINRAEATYNYRGLDQANGKLAAMEASLEIGPPSKKKTAE
jgi:hypothetical protein